MFHPHKQQPVDLLFQTRASLVSQNLPGNYTYIFPQLLIIPSCTLIAEGYGFLTSCIQYVRTFSLQFTPGGKRRAEFRRNQVNEIILIALRGSICREEI